MPVITSTQSKAGRAYLDWSQEDLAKMSGMSLSTVRSFESGFGPRHSSVEFIQAALEKAGVEFTEQEGVQRRSNQVVVFRGGESRHRFAEDIIQTVERHGGDVRCIMKSPDLLQESIILVDHARSAGTLKHEAKVHVKCLVGEQGSAFVSTPLLQLRVIPATYASPSACCIYGTKWAHVIRLGPTDFLFVVYDIVTAVHQYRAHFARLWDVALS